MGKHEDWEQPSGLLPNGLLPNEGVSMIQILDSERWMRAEKRTAELIARIQPNQPSEERRKAVADYVQRMIMKCFTCQVFTFGSVPLKTYLPDGDIDLTAFSNNQGLKDTWAYQVRDMLENEEKNENAEFHVKEVQYIQAEVKIIKCLVENIVVDISFNQLGGLCTLCFLEEVDHLINHDHLFKRSVILIKAWCYYESRILGAHHGLISTYALETLVLYIFHLYNNSFVGPLEVLYRFLEFFSNFDWDNFCLSLWGPVPVSSLPDVTAEPPRKDKGDLLLSKLFLDACSSVYAVFPGGQENQGQPFVSKHFNVIDPLRINNNLGRSVSKGNFYRIRSAFAFGAKKLSKILDCSEENLILEVNLFFMNTWDRHGSGPRPDALDSNLLDSNLQDVDKQQESENIRNNMKNKKSIRSTPSSHGTARVVSCSSRHVVDQCGNSHTEGISRVGGAGVSRGPSQKGHGSANSSYRREVKMGNFVEGTRTDTAAKCVKAGFSANDNQGRYLFARTHSSPELTDSYGEVHSREGHKTVAESGKHQSSLARVDSSKRKNLVPDTSTSQMLFPSSNNHSMPKNFTSQNVLQSGGEVPNNYPSESRACEELHSLESHVMHQEEQDLINMLAYSNFHSFNGHAQVPVNLATNHLPFPVFSSINASMGYGHRNMGGGVLPSISIIEPFGGPNMQFAQGLNSGSLAHYSNAAAATDLNDLDDAADENSGSADMKEGDHEFWHEQDRVSSGGFTSNSRSIEVPHFVDDIQQTYLAGHNVSYGRNSSNYMILQPKLAKVHQGDSRDDNVGCFHHERGNESNEAILVEKASSRVSCDGRSGLNAMENSSIKLPKSSGERRGEKAVQHMSSTSLYGKGRSLSEYCSDEADDDSREWNSVQGNGSEIEERHASCISASTANLSQQQISELESTHMTGPDSLFPLGPVFLGPGGRQRAGDNSSVMPFAFYPTGPPVPFLTMLPVYNIHSETDSGEASVGHLDNDEGLNMNGSDRNTRLPGGFDSLENVAGSSFNNCVPIDSVEQHRSDILNSDFASHWHNLQYGRFCQSPRFHGSMVYPSPVVVPPLYLQGRIPWDGPGRPVNVVSHGPQFVPIASIQSVSNRSTGVYHHYTEEVPRYRSGTGTYLPNPKAAAKDRNSSNARRGSYNYDKTDHHGDKDWNGNVKSRPTGRFHNRNYSEKQIARTANDVRAEKSWGSYRQNTFVQHQSHNGVLPANTGSIAYGLYPLNNGGMSSNGTAVPSVVMLYPLDHNGGYMSGEQLEFGSVGQAGFLGARDASMLDNACQARDVFKEQRFHVNSAQQSPDQPSSPHVQRGI